MRQATVKDVDAIVDMLVAVAPEQLIATEPPVDRVARGARIAEMIEAGSPSGHWVLVEDGAVVGSLGLDESVPGVLGLGMAMLPHARGRGGGRALLDTAIAHAAAVGAHKISLEAWTDNERAIRLYRSAGFEVEGLRRDHYRRNDGSLRSSLIMARRLDARPTVLQRLHAAQQAFYSGGDDAALKEVLTPGIRWHVPGDNAIAGAYEGLDEVLDYFTRRRALADNSFRMLPGAVLREDGEHVAVLTDGIATIYGREHRWSTVGLYRLEGERVAECHLLPLDPKAFDAIWR